MIRRYLVAGLLVWVPLLVTLFALYFLIEQMDKVLKLLPLKYQPDHWMPFHIPGLGLLMSFLLLLVTGLLVRNFLGHHLVNIWERLLARIPVARTIYMSVKQMLETFFLSEDQSFRRVLLLEYPRKGVWSIAFQTGNVCKTVSSTVGESDMICVFLPTTPNPTSGFLLMVSEREVTELKISVDAALRMVISLGIVQPTAKIIEELKEKESGSQSESEREN